MADTETQLSKKAQPADENEKEKVAGRYAAVRVGGMRVVQHKTATNSTAAPTADLEDCTGLTQPPNINTDHVSGALVKGNVDYSPQAAQVAHALKPPKKATAPVQHHINQPRK